jgi:anti-sigma factor (TIGR02949 family)
MTTPAKPEVKAPMSCAEAVRVLWDYLDTELDAVLRERVREHLVECAHCRDHYTFEGNFLRAVEGLMDQPIDTTALRARILDALRARGYGAR